MGILSKPSGEVWLYILSAFFLSFIFNNFRPEVASGIFILLLASFMTFLYDYMFLNKISIPFSRTDKNWGKTIVIAMLSAVGFIVLTSVINGITFQSAIAIFQSTLPVFKDSAILTGLTWMVVIPFVESSAVVRVFEAIADLLKLKNINLKNPLVWVIIVTLGLASALFHATAYGVDNNSALISAFLFFSLGLAISIKMKESKVFIIQHIFINGIALAVI
ncbi:MAG: hypothetical protein U9O94_08400 [Nanoarchaeota archaeon]|nr:hypothetical protein [Nanoarchaeota archaeon]